MYELFVSLLDSLYWDGYTEQLAQSNHELFNYEYSNFLNTYSK